MTLTAMRALISLGTMREPELESLLSPPDNYFPTTGEVKKRGRQAFLEMV